MDVMPTAAVLLYVYVLLSIFFTVIAMEKGIYDKKPITWAQVVLIVFLCPGMVMLGMLVLLVSMAQLARDTMIRVWTWLDRPIFKATDD